MIPNDPMILLSYINTKLRDEYDSLAALKEILAAVGFVYDAGRNRFA